MRDKTFLIHFASNFLSKQKINLMINSINRITIKDKLISLLFIPKITCYIFINYTKNDIMCGICY